MRKNSTIPLLLILIAFPIWGQAIDSDFDGASDTTEFFENTDPYDFHSVSDFPHEDLVFWLDAADLDLEEGVPIFFWHDRSGHDRDALLRVGYDTLVYTPSGDSGAEALRILSNGPQHYIIRDFERHYDEYSVSFSLYPYSTITYNQAVGGSWGFFNFHTRADGAIYTGTNTSTRFSPAHLGPGTLEVGKPHYFTITFKDGLARFYKNGELLAEKDDMATPGLWRYFRIGYYAHGEMSDVVMHQRQLGHAEVAEVQATFARKSSLLLDRDADGMSDLEEWRIVYDSEADAIHSIEDVLPQDDYDQDSSPNFSELAVATDPIDAHSVTRFPQSDLIFWLDAEDLASSNAGPFIENWPDRSGLGNHAVPRNAQTQVPFIAGSTNDVTMAIFDIGLDRLHLPTFPGFYPEYTLTWSLYPYGVRTYNQLFGASWGIFNFHTRDDGSIYVGTNVSTRFNPSHLGPGTMEPGKMHIFSFSFKDGHAKFYLNGQLLAERWDMAEPAPWPYFWLGLDGDGETGEAAMHGAALSDEEVFRAHQYIAAKYSVSSDDRENGSPSKDLKKHLAEGIDSRLTAPISMDNDGNTVNTIDIFSVRDNGTQELDFQDAEYEWNKDSWISPSMLNARSFFAWFPGHQHPWWKTYIYQWYGPTLVTRRHMVSVAHASPPIGAFARFVDHFGEFHDIKIVGRKRFLNTDLLVSVLEHDVPAGITIARVLPPDWVDYLPEIEGAAAFGSDREHKALTRDVRAIFQGTTVSSISFQEPEDNPLRAAYFERAVGGDSGSPTFFWINDEPVLLLTFTSGGGGGGISVTHHTDDIDALITELDAEQGEITGYVVTEVDLSSFHR